MGIRLAKGGSGVSRDTTDQEKTIWEFQSVKKPKQEIVVRTWHSGILDSKGEIPVIGTHQCVAREGLKNKNGKEVSTFFFYGKITMQKETTEWYLSI